MYDSIGVVSLIIVSTVLYDVHIVSICLYSVHE